MKISKKILSLFVSLAVAVTMLTLSVAVVADDEITVTLNGTAIEFDVDPQIINGSTMVPVRQIFEEIGALVKWDGDTQTVSARKGSKTIKMIINSTDMQIDKGNTDDEGNPLYETVTLEVPSQIIDGRTLVPARAISEAFGLDVDWDSKNKNVIITSDDNSDDTWKENTSTINLSDLTYTGDGVKITDNQINITYGGDYTLTGTLEDGNIIVNTTEKVKLRLSGVSVTSSTNPCIYIENAEKAYITLTDGTENSLMAQDSESDAMYSKENLEIKGEGALNITANGGHAIKASDNLTIENGVLNLKSQNDGIHVNDTFKMTGGVVNADVVGDGIDSESIVIIEDGEIIIKTNGTPIEANIVEDTSQSDFPQRPFEDKTDVEFEKSSKGINAEWMMVISGGNITINSASHAIHCQDEIEITGGIFNLNSEYEKGISAHGNLTIEGADTVIDITKSTEGLESKNIMTINNGTMDIVSSDDAINATGGSSGDMMGGGRGQNMRPQEGTDTFVKPERNPNNTDSSTMMPKENRGDREMTAPPGMGERPTLPENGDIQPPNFPNQGGGMPNGNMKDCLIINGGIIEATAGDDCLDANGNIILNGGTINAVKENGTFIGANSVLDPDGKITISENVKLTMAASGGAEGGALSIPHNVIYFYSDTKLNADEDITLKDKSGSIITEYSPKAGFSAVLITSPDIEIGQSYVLTVGDDIYDITVSEQNTIIGTQPTQQGFGNRGFR